MDTRPIRLGCRRDPDDTFRFAALASHAVTAPGVAIEVIEDDAAGLCARAARGELDAAVLPLGFYAEHSQDWRYLSTGFCLGDGYGPLIVSNRVFIEFEIGPETLIHVPTRFASESLVLRLYSDQCTTKEWPSEDMLKAVVEQRIESGVVSDQGIISFGHYGVFKIEDLGEWWKFGSGGLPLVLSGIAVKRSIDEATAKAIGQAVKASILWGVEHRDVALAAARRNARGVNDWILEKFVGLFVTPRSLALDDLGRKGAEELLKRALAKGLVKAAPAIDCVPDA